ncbi:ABC transporter permease subunit [Paenibacillus sacheonensis]|uniref:ABC transporter permease subunit n=1 Tax=Paenibacillus sacheonensis TaxID=742054 RepID=A0A7X5BXF2_9BACL|nr:ABC transporter permease subunit [Paenibacillus sacheonensis]MBM7563107.1 peptide/nickel transport system permease protein [Paenibacillus sacheonensis]NBC68326.1 ABC transporter permease subunit [Paenibacillus sacheonensis]
MSKVAQFTLIVPGILMFVLVFAMFPAVLQAGQADGALQLHFANGFTSLREYVQGLWNGHSFHYLSGKTELSFWEQIGRSFTVTLSYMAVGGFVGMTAGVLLGVRTAVARKPWLKRTLELTSVLPDFVIVILLQFLIVYIASETGLVVFKVASPSTDDPAIALPLLSTIIIPANYMIRNVALHMNQTLTEDYISFAKARGLGKTYIIFYHALPNVLPYVKADLHKFLGILFGNLFIFEYLYNLNGVGMMLFSNAFAFNGYQYGFVVNGILTLLVLYALMYALLRTVIFGWEKVIVR